MFPLIMQSFINDGKEAILREDFSLDIYGSINLRVTARKGFIYDGFSVPLPFHLVQNKWNGVLPAALLHDLAYATHFLSISKADWMFLLIMEMYGESWFHRNLLYSAVRGFGWTVYSKTEKELTDQSQFVIVEKL